jgi:hypothetical protein
MCVSGALAVLPALLAIAVNPFGWTALLEAIILGGGGRRHSEALRLLIDGGANAER